MKALPEHPAGTAQAAVPPTTRGGASVHSGPSARTAHAPGLWPAVPDSVRQVLRSSAQPLPGAARASMGSRFGHDFAGVRVHTDASAADSARALAADAYTIGNHIVFGAGRYAPGTVTGDRLLAHELGHTIQQRGAAEPAHFQVANPSSPLEREAETAADHVMSGRPAALRPGSAAGGALQRQPAPDIGAEFNAAIAGRAWETAVRLLGEMGEADARRVLSAVNTSARAQLRGALLRLDPTGSSALLQQIESSEHPPATTPQQAAGPAAETAPENIAALSSGEKLSRAWAIARGSIGPALRREIEGLFTPASIAAMAMFAALYIASQLTPAGWVADAIALTLVSLSVLFLGMLAIEIARDLFRFFAVINATSEADLRASGDALARALARGGVAIFIALLSKTLPRGGAGGGSAAAELVAAGPGGVRVPVRIQAVQEVPAAIPRHLQIASYAVMVPPPSGTGQGSANGTAGGGGDNSGGGKVGGSGGGSGPSGGGPVRGPEIWEELSAELALDRPGTGEARSGGVRGAVDDARAGGLVGPAGVPGTADMAVQTHSSAPAVRQATGVTGAQAQSAHVGPTSALRDAAGYSRGGALTTLLDPKTHAAFDAHWKGWAIRQRQAGRTTTTVSELQGVMLDAIDQIPGVSQRFKNTLAWRLQMEIRELGLQPTDELSLPYRNIPARTL